MADFFISYTGADKAWAEWIGYVLEEEGFSTVIQAWDFGPGSNFVLEMQKAVSESTRTIMVLSPDYLKSQYAPPEWAGALASDPQGAARKLVPVVVRPCQPTGLLTAVVHINLVDQDESAARKLLVEGVSGSRAKPAQRPSFPGRAARAPKSFPGRASAAAPPASSAYMPKLRREVSDVDKRRFTRNAFEVIKAHFQGGLEALGKQNGAVEHDLQLNTASEITAEIFVNGKSACRCRIWLGGLMGTDSISFFEGRDHGGNACNEMLTVAEDRGELFLSALMGMGFSPAEQSFDLKRLTPEQAADYLWRRLVQRLES